MKTMKTVCPACESKLRCASEAIGKFRGCPSCGTPFLVQAPHEVISEFPRIDAVPVSHAGGGVHDPEVICKAILGAAR